MKTCILVNSNIVVPLNDFTQSYIANVLCAIANSLGIESKYITVCMERNELRIHTEDGEVETVKKFAKEWIESTIKGMLSPLKGVLCIREVVITSRRAE
ncbi:MAG: hypothetical protein A2077_04190 [Nitrospirae bacterium GWC2_46_6]|nr:MAG: hypothetical protein A2077_04190 [Nitrospirae bacterium GWC2_46_6]OGW20824.1 MAG: hypothetical protein A2Z82_11370 [Nitrospirae bacterium GWA2_46_11]OGW23378.1 MAG: hypothetical protein A2X55_12095 [Nitrospirae bacterium GWB2_47_37]HAK88940.1 hypothetical protein [Nitrospiraceae bacterium]HCL80673.1 hypothetical protein [Nitrospiraceae bacterium]